MFTYMANVLAVTLLSVATSTAPAHAPTIESSAADSVVANGSFIRIDRSYWARGEATIVQEGDAFFLEFGPEFEVRQGPDLRILVSSHSNPDSADELGDYTELAPLQSNEGNQRYRIPDSVDVTEVGSVVIFCKPYQVIFSTATITPVS